MPAWQQLAPIFILPLLLFMSWLTRKWPTAMYYPSNPTHFRVKRRAAAPSPANGNGHTNATASIGNGKTESLDIRGFLEAHVPSLFDGYAPTWWLPTGHLQTGFVVAGDFTRVDQVVYERTLLRLPDGGTIGLDTTPPPQDVQLPSDTPIVVVQHGLTGGSYESYVRSILSGACAPKSEGGLGFRGIVINYRGCANVPVTSTQFYSAAHTDDLRCGLHYISNKYPNAPLVGLGFSLGANIITRYLGEEGGQSRLRAGLALACPWDVVKNMKRLRDEFVPRHIYSKALGANLLNLFTTHLDVIRTLPDKGRMTPDVIENVLALKNPTFQEMDEVLTRIVGGSSPTFPLPSAEKYYEHAASHKHVHAIRVPFLAINAADDPIVAFNPTDETEHSKTCALAITPYGGHLGWFHGGAIASGLTRWRPTPPDRWVRFPTLEFLKACAEEYIPDSKLGPRHENVQGANGYIFEKGRTHIGYKVVAEGQIIRGQDDNSSEGLIKGL